jgi:hypothetical protein
MAKDAAVGSQEAAALMGVHWTTPAKMVAKGLIRGREISCGAGDAEERLTMVFSRLDAEDDWAAYAAKMAKGGTGRRPRGYADNREDALRALAKAPHIGYEDAIGAAEAAAIMKVSGSWPPRLAAAGEIVGRVLWASRTRSAKVWIFSKRSCVENALKVERMRLEGKSGPGRPRRRA